MPSLEHAVPCRIRELVARSVGSAVGFMAPWLSVNLLHSAIWNSEKKSKATLWGTFVAFKYCLGEPW